MRKYGKKRGFLMGACALLALGCAGGDGGHLREGVDFPLKSGPHRRLRFGGLVQ